MLKAKDQTLNIKSTLCTMWTNPSGITYDCGSSQCKHSEDYRLVI